MLFASSFSLYSLAGEQAGMYVLDFCLVLFLYLLFTYSLQRICEP